MTDIFNYSDYKLYLIDYQEQLPKKGWGFNSKLAEHLKVNSTLISQILKGPKDFSLEQALKVTYWIGLNDLQREFFLILVNEAKAGTQQLKNYYNEKRKQLQRESMKVSNRVEGAKILDDSQKAQFYSDPYYSAVKILCGIDAIQSLEQIADHLNIPQVQVAQILNFLKDTGLVIQEDGILKSGLSKTHIGSKDPLTKVHHRNWRNYASQHYYKIGDDELAFTAPLSLSREDFIKCKGKILALIEEISKVVTASPAEEAAVLNIDWLYIN